jgi:hypothetical protein
MVILDLFLVHKKLNCELAGFVGGTTNFLIHSINVLYGLYGIIEKHSDRNFSQQRRMNEV